MALTAAQIQHVHLTAQELTAAGQGRRGEITARAAALLGCAEKTVYAHLKKYAGWSSGKKKRSDAGKTCVDEDLALLVGGLVHESLRQKDKGMLSIKDSCSILGSQGYGAVNPETGEVTMPSPETVARVMRTHYGCHPKQLTAAAPAVRMRSLHPNHCWQVDASVCVLYRLPGGQVRLLDEKVYNEHKPGKLIEISGQRIIRYIVTDHYSHNFYVHFEQARGEDALGVLRAVMGAACDRGPRDPMHGLPRMLYCDPGSGNTSSLVRDFCKNLGIRLEHHGAGNARATGSVEVAQNITECKFEARLRFMKVPDVAALQEKADAWRRHYLATSVHTRTRKTRNAVWLWISDAQLRTVQRPVLEAIAAWQDVRCTINNHFRTTVNTRVFGVCEYDLRELGYHGVNAKDTLMARLHPFKAPTVTFIKVLPDGTELLFDVPPVEKEAAGYDLSAPVIGEEYRALPDTKSQKALKKIRKMAYQTDSIEEAEKAHKNKARVPFAHIDMMADITEAPLHFRKKGADVGLAAPVVEVRQLNRVLAGEWLREMCKEAFTRDAVACMDMVKTRYSDTVPEDKLEELAAAINDRFAPRPARVAVMPLNKTLEGGAACASA